MKTNKRRYYSQRVKAACVNNVLHKGLSAQEVANMFKIPKPTIASWVAATKYYIDKRKEELQINQNIKIGSLVIVPNGNEKDKRSQAGTRLIYNKAETPVIGVVKSISNKGFVCVGIVVNEKVIYNECFWANELKFKK